MLIAEHPYNGRQDRIRHYSDAGFTVRRIETGDEFGEAIDRYREPLKYTYEETDHPIEPDEPEELNG